MEPINGKLEKNPVLLPYCGYEAATSHDRAKRINISAVGLYFLALLYCGCFISTVR